MAVAVKTSPGARPATSPATPAVLSLVGVVYLVACLALLFQVIPGLFWPAWQSAGLGKFTFQGGALLVLVCLAAAAFLCWAGGQLLGPNAPVGVRAGVFTALVGLLLVALLARWASLWIEHWSYSGLFSPQTGMVVAAVVAVGLLVLFLRLFFSEGVQQGVAQFEEAGWFSATNYKGNQGQLVRRGTIFGILLLTGAGIYTLINSNTLRRYGPDWAIPIPFTGTVAVESFGDGAADIADDKLVPDSAKAAVEIRLPGSTRYAAGQAVSLDVYKGAIEKTLDGDKELAVKIGRDLTAAHDKDASAYVREVNRIVYDEINAWLALPISERLISEDTTRRLRGIDNETDMADLSKLVVAFKREVGQAATRRIRVVEAGDSALLQKQVGKIVLRDTFNSEAGRLKAQHKTPPVGEDVGKLGPVFDLPLAVLRVDRFALQKVDEKMDPAKYVRVESAGESKFNTGAFVTKEEFDEEVERLKGRNLAETLPRSQPVSLPDGPTRYAQLTLLPAITFTVPLLLIAMSLWLAWRVVNVPAFADFLIATEAELNKVSWTTQKRLVQDTIVVLVTVVVMALFLFFVDWGWKTLLQTIRVLHIPKESAEKQMKVEDKKY